MKQIFWKHIHKIIPKRAGICEMGATGFVTPPLKFFAKPNAPGTAANVTDGMAYPVRLQRRIRAEPWTGSAECDG